MQEFDKSINELLDFIVKIKAKEIGIPHHIFKMLALTAFFSSQAYHEARVLPMIRKYILENFNIDIFKEKTLFFSEGPLPWDIRIVVPGRAVFLVEVGKHSKKQLMKKIEDAYYWIEKEQAATCHFCPTYWIHVDSKRGKITHLINMENNRNTLH